MGNRSTRSPNLVEVAASCKPIELWWSFNVPATCVIGLQWGDEAKGKLVDLLAPKHDIVVRYQGGANAGHTVVSGDDTYKLHHIPSGILHAGVMNVIGPGVVLEPSTMIREIEGLQQRGVPVMERLMVSERAHVVMPWHLVEDQILNQQEVEGENIGTTLRGIGPCYRDKVGRTHAIRVADLLDATLPEKIAGICRAKQRWLSGLATPEQLAALEPEKVMEKASPWIDCFSRIARDTTHFLHDSLDQGQQLLMEGAQGALLDIDHGTFPFVTSSNSSGAGISSGSGVPAKWIERVIGVVKGYSTRVGGGPFPTELLDATGNRIRELGREYGTTTGRPRRCGWFDAVAVRYTARLSGATALAVMMMDVLSQLDEVRLAVAYQLHGKRIEQFPSRASDLRECQPIYEVFPGWNKDLSGARSVEEFPEGAIRYLRRIEELVGVPIEILSVGPDRRQTIFSKLP